MKRLLLPLLLMLAGCDRAETAAPPAQPESRPVSALVIVDLSTSISDAQQASLAGLILGYVSALPTRSTFSVHALETQMGNGEPLLGGEIPRAVTIVAKDKFQTDLAGWHRTLSENLRSVASVEERRPLLTSCYLKSMAFAGEFFSERTSADHQIVWFGDMIEDCHDVPEFMPFAVPHAGDRGLHRLQKDDRLKDARAIAVLVPRGSKDHARQIDPDVVAAYWRSALPRVGIPANRFRIGSPAVLGFTMWEPQEK